MTRKRNVHIQFWLSETEAKDFQRRVRRSGLSRESYLRQIIKCLRPKETPPPDYHTMMNELRRIGASLSQLTAAHSNYDWDATDRLVDALDELEETIRTITEKTLKPESFDIKEVL
jgi:hypothetical protein